ncbi:MAG: hypothetical protein IT160_01435 [Bryobacterales bacterium]|nr:hypothetical protein [Bryobacterales bacterium]
MSRTASASILIFLAAAGVRLVLIFGFHCYEIGRPEPVRIAISLARHGVFGDPYALPTGPTAHAAPVYPMLISPLYALWGDTRAADFARFVLNTLAASAEYALLPLVSVALGLGLLPGVLAGAAGALIPLHLWVECIGDFEGAWVALFLEAAVVLFARWLRAPRLNWRNAACWGAIWGAGFLLTPNVLPVLVALFAIGAWILRPRAAAAARWLAIFTAAVSAVFSPWLIRNYRQLGGVFFVRDNFGLELLVSNYDGAAPNSEQNFTTPHFAQTHPYISAEASREIQERGELAFESRALRRALGWIRSNPLAFAKLTAARVWNYWIPRVPRLRWVLASIALAALAGLVMLYRESRGTAAVLAAVLIGYSAVYYIVENTLRYQHPLWWIQLLLVASLVNRGARLKLAQRLCR